MLYMNLTRHFNVVHILVRATYHLPSWLVAANVLADKTVSSIKHFGSISAASISL